MVYKPRTEEGTPLDSAIKEMDIIAKQYPGEGDYFSVIKGSLSAVRERHESGKLTVEQASYQLFNIYFHLPAGILRVVGDDFGVQLGTDSKKLWDLYQRSLERHS